MTKLNEKFEKYKVTLIGGSGFVGTNLCAHLLKNENYNIEIIDIKKSKKYPELCKIGDVRDIDSLRRSISGNIVVNLAAVHRDDISDVGSYYRTNVEGAKNVAKVCSEKDIKKIIFTSSVAVYGHTTLDTDENGEIRPFNEYGKSKFAAEQKFLEWAEFKNNSLIIVRPTVIFGEGNRGNIYNLLKYIESNKFIMVGNGKNIKSISYIENIVNFLEMCILADIKFGIFNYVDTPNMSVNQIVAYARKEINGQSGVGMRLPLWLGISMAWFADVFSNSTGIKLPISVIRVRKFTTSSAFTTAHPEFVGAAQKVELLEGLRRTIHKEFISSNVTHEIFSTE